MSSAVAELDGYLQSMLALKPPGVSGSRISNITSLCIANVQFESVIVQKIYTHFKRAPGTHKLGVLYAVDSVTRQWVEAARKSGQTLGSGAPDGSFAAGVHRVTELLPSLMTDIINTAPQDQKEKIKKLVDIWERSNTFPAPMLTSFKEKLNAPQNASTTPEGSPAPGYVPVTAASAQQQQQQQQARQQTSTPTQGQPDTSSILKALADMAKQNNPTPQAAPAPPAATTTPTTVIPSVLPQTQANPTPVLSTASPFPAAAAPSVDPAQQASAQTTGAYANPLAGLSSLAQSQSMFASQPPAANPLMTAANPLAALLQPQQPPAAAPAPTAPAATGAGSLPPETLQQLNLIPLLAAQGIPQEQWATALQIISLSNQANGGAMGSFNPAALAAAFGQQPASTPFDAASASSRDRERERERERDRDYLRSPPPHRRRSRSPGWDRRRDLSPPRRRDSPVYADFRGDSPGGRRGGRYRQRSPDGEGGGSGGGGGGGGRRRGGRRGGGGGGQLRTPSPRGNRDPNLPPPGPKNVEWDYSLLPGNIKVLSRTLFVGGVTIPESHLRSLFSRYGIVQTCIVNLDKRHAFVKMLNRRDAVTAREGMESYKSGDMQLRTRWGVGFGPRDCSDYQTGVSTIPIERLTDADRKWMLTAEYGGTGGKPIDAGMVVEEPDIEIGAGVSSKAISRRMATDQGGKRGPQSSRGAERFRRERDDIHGPVNAYANFGNGSDSNPNNIALGAPHNPAHAAVNPMAATSGPGVPPAVPGFGYSFPGMPFFPGSFLLPNGGAGGTAAPDAAAVAAAVSAAASATPHPQGQGK